MAGLTTVVPLLPVFLVGGLAIQVEYELGVDATILGVVIAAFWAVSAVLSPSAGYAANRLGARRGMPSVAALALVALLGIAFFAPRWPWLLLWLGIAGAANALGQPLSNSLIVGQVAIKNRAFAFGIKQAAAPGATLVAGISVPVVALSLGWKWAFGFGAIFAAVLIVMLVRLLPRGSTTTGTVPDKGSKFGIPKHLKPFLLATAIANGLGSAQANITTAFTVTFAVASGFDMATAGLLLGLASCGGILARLLVGIAADHRVGGSMATVAIMIGIGSIGILGMAAGNRVSFAVGCVAAFGFGWGWSGLVQYVISHRAQSFTAQATGIVQSGTYLGGVLGPLSFGFVFANFGPVIGWTGASVVGAAGVVAALVAYRLEKRL